MDHSVRGYLERQSTDKLNHILRTYQGQNCSSLDQEMISIILDILRKRENQSLPDVL